jgi:putative transposase
MLVDNGTEFNNATFDKLLALLGTTKINRPPRDPRFSSEVESFFRTLDVEFAHNLVGNTQPLPQVRDMTSQTDPKRQAVWTLTAFCARLDEYLFDLFPNAPSASLGTTPRNAFERDMKRAPDRKDQFALPPEIQRVAFLPEVKNATRRVQPGRGIYVEGYYYWHESMAHPKIERTRIFVRYDPYELYTVFALINAEWVSCAAQHAPELRNVTERTRKIKAMARRRLRNTHAKRREDCHGPDLAKLGAETREQEKVLRQQRNSRLDNASTQSPPAAVPVVAEPTVDTANATTFDFTHLRDEVA